MPTETLELKYVKDLETGERVLPITHVNAVRDSQGNALPTLMVPEKQGTGIGTCSTAAGTQALLVSLTGYELVQNGIVAVTFENDVPANATLNINSKGAKPIIYKGDAITADTIAAGDTVMFGYDGTNYVVTSLGGGGGSSVYPEFVAIQLTQSGGSDSALIGATIVVTNDHTSETILSTTWQGSNISVQVDAGVDYTVTVGNVTGLIIKPNTQSYTAVSGLSRIITFSYLGNVVDLGLPSGTLWCAKNVGATSPEGYGQYFSWGNTGGHTSGDGYTFSSSSYSGTTGSSLTGSIQSGNSAYDGARAVMGEPWRMPTNDEFTELINNTTRTAETINGINCFKFTSKINQEYIIFPKNGEWTGSNIANLGANCGYWSCGYSSNSVCYQFFNGALRTENRFIGYGIRAVK